MRKTLFKACVLATALVGFQAQQAQAGILLRVFYDGDVTGEGIPGTAVDDLRAVDFFPAGPTNPDGFYFFTDIWTNAVAADRAMDLGVNYGSYVRGYVQAPMDGDYTFFTASDDASELWLSSDTDPANIALAAEELACCTPLFSGARLAERSSDAVALSRGEWIYFEILHKEGGGGDWVEMGWQRPDGVQEIVPTAYVAPLPLDAPNNFSTESARQNVAPVILAEYGFQLPNSAGVPGDPYPVPNAGQPATQSIAERDPVWFTVAAEHSFPVTYQWMRNGTDIPDATLASYFIPNVSTADNGDEFSVRISNGQGQVTSDAAVLTVIPDTEPPRVVGVSHRGNPNGVRVTFSEPVDEAQATDVNNYSIDGGALTIDTAELLEDQVSVQLSGNFDFQLGNTYQVQISDIQDRADTPNTIDPNPHVANITYAGGEGLLYDFNSGLPGNVVVYGNSAVVPSGSYDDSGYLSVTDGVGSQTGAVLFTDRLDISRVRFTFKARIWDGSGNPADGYSFNVAADLPEGTYPQAEEGYVGGIADAAGGTPVTGLAVAFDNYFSGAPDPAPAIKLKYAGEQVAAVPMPKTGNTATVVDDIPSMLRGDRWFDVVIDIGPDGSVFISYDGFTIVDGLQLENWTGIQNAQVGFGARTGGEWETHWFDDLNINFAGGEVGPVTIAEQPVSITADENTQASLAVTLGGADPYSYQWRKDGEPIEGATSRVYAFNATPSDAGEYDVVVMNEFSEATSETVTVTVNTDNEAPTIVSASADGSLEVVRVDFSEPLDAATATDTANYAISGGLTVDSAALSADGMQVVLTTSPQTPRTSYTLTVNDVQDLAATPNVITPDSTIGFNSWGLAPGLVWESYHNITGTPVANLTNNANFPDFPDETLFMSRFDTRTVRPDDTRENYGARMSGFFIPAETGDHRFYIRSDDASQLRLSTTEDPADSVLIAFENGCCRTFDATVTDGTLMAQSELINLTAGERYYIEALLKEGGGGDWMKVAVRQPSEDLNTPPASGDTAQINPETIPGDLLASYQPVPELPAVLSMTPNDGAAHVLLDTGISVQVRDGFDTVDSGSITVTLNGSEVTADVTQVTDSFGVVTTTISYTPPADLDNGTVHTVAVSYSTAGGEDVVHQWQFTTVLIPEIPAGTVFIEAEDFNYDGGQYVAGANGGPTGQAYTGGAYQDLVGVSDIDFSDTHFPTSPGGGGAPLYRYAPGTVDNMQPGPATVGFTAAADITRSTFDVTANWKVGWTAPGEWMNFTREFPATPGTYAVYARISSGGSAPDPILHRVTSDPTQTGQTTEALGEFSGPPSGDWNRMVFYRLHEVDDPATPQNVTLGGVNTLRLTIGDGNMDVDYLAFVPTEPGGPVFTSITLDAGNATLEWEGDGVLQSAPSVAGPWSNVDGATSGYEVAVDGAEMLFYRIVSSD